MACICIVLYLVPADPKGLYTTFTLQSFMLTFTHWWWQASLEAQLSWGILKRWCCWRVAPLGSLTTTGRQWLKCLAQRHNNLDSRSSNRLPLDYKMNFHTPSVPKLQFVTSYKLSEFNEQQLQTWPLILSSLYTRSCQTSVTSIWGIIFYYHGEILE